jgi:formylglycine-generating enzyme required for sulfatase activity
MKLLWLVPLAACAGVHGQASTHETVLVPDGAFEMGCHQAVDPNCNPDEMPYHTVSLLAFRIDRTEVTQAEYAACVATGACTVPAASYDPVATPDLPVSYVSWFQADTYCRAQPGGSLPTEAQWEKAARGTDDRIYPWGDDPPTCELANFADCGGAVVPVGMYPAGASPYGALDMAGNVAEWVDDWYDAGFYAVSPSEQPTGPTTGTDKIKRGGDYSRDAVDVRASRRGTPPPGDTEAEKGFRCAYPAD